MSTSPITRGTASWIKATIILVVLLIAGCSGPPGASSEPMTNAVPSVVPTVEPTATPTAVPSLEPSPSAPSLVSIACDDAFAKAAAVDDLHDTVTDLDPAVSACVTVAEWTAASVANPGAISEGVDPAEFLANRCAESYLASTALCKSIAPSLATDTAAIIATLCAAPAYSGCASSLQSVIGQLDPGQLLAVCAYGDGTGDIVLIDSKKEAESTCSADGLLSPSRVIRIVRLP